MICYNANLSCLPTYKLGRGKASCSYLSAGHRLGVLCLLQISAFIGHTSVPIGIYSPHAGTRLMRIGAFNPDTFQYQTNGLNFHTNN